MRREINKFLFDALQAGNDIRRYTDGLKYADYERNDQLRAAVERKFQIIGEALNRIRRLDPDTLNRITDHDDIIGFRNVITHGYDTLNNFTVWPTAWNVMQQNMTVLLTELQTLIEER